MQLSSPCFRDGKPIPRDFTCEGRNISPALSWSDAPAGTRSFALICRDVDAPAGHWYHWAIFDLPGGIKQLPEACPSHRLTANAKQALNDFSRFGYGGPCPPPGHGVHHYHFCLQALDVAELALEETATARDVEKKAAPHVITEAVLTGVYSR